ncbi:MAG: Na/Pi symporter, partial [Prevotellaceae bacterium]|nr:Na/Pi symporter [Prevotellaceae bacterium]
MDVIFSILTLIGSIGLFLYGMMKMSDALQKVAGEKMRNILATMTSNPLKRILTGTFVTSVIQSSSATTVMIVSFVNAGLMTLTQSIGVIMGANIGTTATAWIIALLGFKADIATLALPIIAFGVPMMM